MLSTNQLDLFGGEPHEQGSRRKRNGHRRETNGHKQQPVNGDVNERIESLERSVDELASKLTRIESVLCDLHALVTNRQTIKDSYTTQEVAKILDKKPYTVREWCRLQRVNAFKAMCGRGCEEEWRINHEELLRIQNEGLLPPPERY